MIIKIDEQPHEILSNVYNMAFGPLNSKGRIDDRAQLTYKDYSKVFSTILWSALTYLKDHTDHSLGIDGSDNRRAHMYYRFLQRNYEYLDKCFRIYGIKYYVRITRFGKQQYENPFDFEDVQYVSSPVGKNSEIPSPMINYFIIDLK